MTAIDLRLDLQHRLIERTHLLKIGGYNRDECQFHQTPLLLKGMQAYMDGRTRFAWMARIHTLLLQHELGHHAEVAYQCSTRV